MYNIQVRKTLSHTHKTRSHRTDGVHRPRAASSSCASEWMCDLCLFECTIFQLALFINISSFLMTRRSPDPPRHYIISHVPIYDKMYIYIFITGLTHTCTVPAVSSKPGTSAPPRMRYCRPSESCRSPPSSQSTYYNNM